MPEPFAEGRSEEGAWLITSFIHEGRSTSESMARLGHGLALLHDAALVHDGASEGRATPGWPSDNWIGGLRQVNGSGPSPTGQTSWADFWVEQRLRVQTELARENGYCDHGLFDQVMQEASGGLPEELPLGLLHGDLWSGNVLVRDDGTPALIDPAVYIGHGEVDLAMSELFGGFSRDFYAAYDAVRPISAEYRSFRRELYQLYYLLVHVNLFGASYERAAVKAARHVVGELA